MHLLSSSMKRTGLSYRKEQFVCIASKKYFGLLLREKLFDYVDIVVAPILIGGKNTSTLIDGVSIENVKIKPEVKAGKPLHLCTAFEAS